jgi:hypothetical protein
MFLWGNRGQIWAVLWAKKWVTNTETIVYIFEC